MSNSKSKKKKKNKQGSKKLSNENLKALTVFHAVSIALVIAMFIFTIFPAFDFKVTLGTEERSTYSEKKEIEREEKKINEKIDDLMKINLLHPLSILESEEFTEALGIDEPSSEDVDILSIGYNISLAFAIIQSLLFLGTILALIFALLKPWSVKVARILPMILSICGIIYSILFFALFKAGLSFLASMIDEGKIEVLLTFSGWAYLIISIALCTVTAICNKKKKKLKI